MLLSSANFASVAKSRIIWLGVVLLAMGFAWTFSACGSDETATNAATTCASDTDCPVGTVCSATGECVEAECDFCEGNQICYRTPENPEGTCSAPECQGPGDCPDGQECIDGQCGGPFNAPQDPNQCSSPADCDDGMTCSPAGQCVQASSQDECQSADDCDGTQICVEGACVDDDNNDECDTDALECAPPTPYIDVQSCSCVACLTDTDCDTDQSCSNGTCVDDSPNTGECTPCDPNEPGTCQSPTPYCVNQCCVECIGSGDCSGTEACVDGFCGDPGGCSSDAECPSGFSCENGQCQEPDTGESCDPEDPDACPELQTCDPTTETCQSLGGDLGCGFCLDDCTCPSGTICEGNFACTGCGVFGEAGECPQGTFCAFDFCIPNF